LKLFTKNNKLKHSDKELINLYKSTGNSIYVGELFQRYTHLISALAYQFIQNSTETEDAVMEIFEILLHDLKIYEVENFKSWLYSVTKNHALKVCKKTKQNRTINEELKNNEHDIVEFDDEITLSNEKIKEIQLLKLEEAIKQLSDDQKICIELFFLKDKSYAEIVEETGYNMNQVKSYIQNGKRNLKVYLEKYE